MNKSFKSAGAFILGLVILAVGYFGVYDYYGKMGEARTLRDASKAENERLEKALTDIQAFVSDYNTSLTQAQMAEKALPVGDPDNAELLDYYSRMVKDSGLALIDLTLMQSNSAAELANAEEGSIQSVDWDVSASGSFESFKDFLMRIRNGLRLTDVLSINTDLADEVTQDGRTLRYTVKLRTYYQK